MQNFDARLVITAIGLICSGAYILANNFNLLIVALWAWGSCSVIAGLCIGDDSQRNFLEGTLRHHSYQQLYRYLVSGMINWLWKRFCHPVDGDAGLGMLFRAALSVWLYKAALVIALFYPVFLITAQWIISGQAAQLGNYELFPTAGFWWERAVILCAFVILFPVVTLRSRVPAPGQRLGKAAPWLEALAVTLAFALAVTFLGSFAVAFALAFALALAFAFAFSGADAVPIPLTAVLAPFALAFAFALSIVPSFVLADEVLEAVSLVFAFAFLLLAYLLSVALAFALLLAIKNAIESRIKHQGRDAFAMGVLTAGVVVMLLGSGLFLPWAAVSQETRAVFLFLAVLPLVNAWFDMLSYAVTLSFLRRGLCRGARAFFWGIADVLIACGIFLALGIVLIFVVHGMNALTGVEFVDLRTLLQGIEEQPWDYIWVYLMVFSTIVPTAVHGLVSLVALQGIWPQKFRRKVANWVKNAPQSNSQGFMAAIAQGFVWAGPVFLLCLLVWLMRYYGRDALTFALGWYWELLHKIAVFPLGLG